MNLEDMLVWALQREKCGWCNGPMSDHTADEYRKCLYRLLLTKEGTNGDVLNGFVTDFGISNNQTSIEPRRKAS